MPTLFDRFLIVDWSASNEPKRGKDSIWVCEATKHAVCKPENIPTRRAAIDYIASRCEVALARGERLFAGFDFPFGYPKGAASLIAGAPRWDALWQHLNQHIEDDDRNRSNRFHFADRLNREVFGEPIYWGRPHQHYYEHLPAKKSASGMRAAMEFRIAERAHRGAKSVWQLSYNGAVGSQAMLGMAHLEELRSRFGERVSVWPFETDFANRLAAPLLLAEIYPSIFPVELAPGEVKDSAQVRELAERFAKLDQQGGFKPWLDAPSTLGEEALAAILAEEGWIVGPGTLS